MHLCHAAPSSRPLAIPPVEFIRTGTVSPNAEHLVRYVEEDSTGELRLIEVIPQHPVRIN